jgi:hypothetical protein
VIPRDVIEEAVDECNRTLKSSIDLDKTKITTMIEKFEELGVTREQIQARIQRSIDAIQPAQYLAMRRIYTSIADGITTAAQAFPAIEEEATKDKGKK